MDQVPAAYTSETCSRCGYTEEGNRDGRRFYCRSCGYENDADYNAAKNIALRYLALHGQTLPGGAGHGKLALTSGTMTPSEILLRELLQHTHSPEDENTDKAPGLAPG